MSINKNSPRKLAFVLPRFGKDINGGAETLVGQLCMQLASLENYEVEILTTCAKDNRTWENEYAEGEEYLDNLLVKRFKVDARNLDVWVPLQLKIQDNLMLNLDQQLDWMQESVNSVALYNYIQEKQADYDYFFFAPYLFGVTFWGSLIVPEKSVLIPCLHDEEYAYLDIIQSMLRQVHFCMFNAEAEQKLAETIYGKIPGGVVGMGFDLCSQQERDQIPNYFSEPDFDYVLYLGRKETGKNLHLLVQNFEEIKKDLKGLKLVIAGSGDFQDVADPQILKAGDIIDLGRVSESEKRSLLKYSRALIQPSTNESFSIVLMEAWDVQTAVIVPEQCAVTSEHVAKSAGGYIYEDCKSLSQILQNLDESESLSKGQAGKSYVEREYSWAAVLKRFEDVLAACDQTKAKPQINNDKPTRGN